MRQISERGLLEIKRHEGTRLRVYLDSANLKTIGTGHLLTKSELASGKIHMGSEVIRWDDGITQEESDTILRSDLASARACVDRFAPGVNDNQFAALVSLAFNIGNGAFEKSTLVKLLRAGDVEGAADQFLRWNRAAGQVVAGLTRRREDERSLFLAETRP
jgi:lysozyme